MADHGHMFDRIRSYFRPETRTLDLVSAGVLVASAPTAAGPTVNAETAMRSPTALACSRALAETLGSLPCHVYRRTADGGRERAREHPADEALNGFSNPWTPAPHLRTQLQYDALFFGAGYARVVRVGGTVREVHRLDPRSVTVRIADDGEPSYEFRPKSGGVEVLSWQDVLHLVMPGADVEKPLSILTAAREAIALDLALSAHSGRVFRDGGRPSGVLQSPRKLAGETLARLKASWTANHAGEASGRTAILEDGITFEPISRSPVDLQLLELRRFQVEEIARAFRVPAVLINDLERATWRNVEELSSLFRSYCLLPWLEAWEGAIGRALFTADERREYFVEFVLDDLLRADIASRFQAYREAAGGAWLLPNEIRALENRPPVDGGDSLIMQAGQGGAADGNA